MEAAKDNGADKVIYNHRIEINVKPKKVLSYLERTYHPPTEEVTLFKKRKKGGLLDKFIEGERARFEKAVAKWRESVEKERDGDGWYPSSGDFELKQKVEQSLEMIKRNYKQYFEAFPEGFISHYRPFFEFEKSGRIPDFRIGGKMTGYVFEVEK